MLSKPWVWVVRIIWMVLFIAALMIAFLLRNVVIYGPPTAIGSLGIISCWIGMLLLFYFCVLKAIVPEAYPDSFFEVKQDKASLQVGQINCAVYIALIFICIYPIAFLFDGSIGPNRSFVVVLIAAVVCAAMIVMLCIWIIRAWPCWMMFSIDDEGVCFQESGGETHSIRYGNISRIVVSRRQIFRGTSINLIGKVITRRHRFYFFGVLKDAVRYNLKVRRFWHRGINNEEILQRILAHCDDSVQVQYVRTIGR